MKSQRENREPLIKQKGLGIEMGFIFDVFLLAVIIGLVIAYLNSQSKFKEITDGKENSNKVIQEGFQKLSMQVKSAQNQVQELQTRLDAIETRLYMVENKGVAED